MQKEFNEVYKSFYSSHSLVFSLPFVINRAGDIHINYPGVSIKQKLPLRMYFWIKIQKKKNDFQFGEIQYYDTNTKEFIKTHCYNFAPYFLNLEKYLINNYHELLKWYGVEISILSEVNRWVWLWFNPLITTLCSILVNYLPTKEIFLSTMQKEWYIYDILNSPSISRKIILDSIWFDLTISPYPSISTKICSIFNGYYPIVGFREDDINYNEIHNLTLLAYRLDDLFQDLNEVPCLPFDCSIIYSWKPVIGEQLVNNHKWFSDWNIDQQHTISEIFVKHINKLAEDKKPKFYKEFLQKERNMVTESYSKSMWWISLEILYNLYNSLWWSFNDSIYHQLIRSLNKIKHWNEIIRKNSKEFSDFMTQLYDHFEGKKDSIAIIPNDTSAMGWTAILVSPLDICRGYINRFVWDSGQKDLWSALIYSSRENGLSKAWLEINQDTERNIYSQFIDNSKFILIDSTWNQTIGELKELRNSPLCDIVFDISIGKIFIWWERVTSQQLVSQQSTIDIFYKYYENGYTYVYNKQLPSSSYTKQKNEMTSKIVVPLKKLIQEKLNTNIDIKLHWPSWSFETHIDLHWLRIWFIKKASE